MKLILSMFTLLIVGSIVAQDITYSIHVPRGSGNGALGRELPSSIDSNHYYSWPEIKEVGKPFNGWSAFYHKMDSLEYPQEAKKEKLQTLMTIGFNLDEKGSVDSVFISNIEIRGRWKKCEECESLIFDYIKKTKWLPGKIRDSEVKTLNYVEIVFEIKDPNSKQPMSPFGY